MKQVGDVTLIHCPTMSAWVQPQLCLNRQQVAASKTVIKGAGRKGAVRQNAKANDCWMCLDCELGRKVAEVAS
jgi:hypothetical protein